MLGWRFVKSSKAQCWVWCCIHFQWTLALWGMLSPVSARMGKTEGSALLSPKRKHIVQCMLHPFGTFSREYLRSGGFLLIICYWTKDRIYSKRVCFMPWIIFYCISYFWDNVCKCYLIAKGLMFHQTRSSNIKAKNILAQRGTIKNKMKSLLSWAIHNKLQDGH